MFQRLGLLIRESGVALDKLGCVLMGNFAFREQLSRSRPVMSIFQKQPTSGKDVFIAPNAAVIGDVKLANSVSVFYGAILRGDFGKITVGEGTNIQDGTIISTAPSFMETKGKDTSIGSKVTIGHNTSLHGCTIEDEALIGMGASLLEGSKVEKGSMVAAGAVVLPGTIVPAGEIWGGNPARHLRYLKPEESKFLAESADHYIRVSGEHLKTANMDLLDIAKAKGLA